MRLVLNEINKILDQTEDDRKWFSDLRRKLVAKYTSICSFVSLRFE